MKKFEILMPAKVNIPSEKTYSASSALSATDMISINFDEITEFVSSLKEFELDSIELNLEAAIETEGVVKLFVGVSGSAGVKVKIKKSDK